MKFRKKPVVIEAFQAVSPFDVAKLPQWLIDATAKDRDEVGAIWGTELGGVQIFVNTLEGPLKISENDWIIKGVQGELYPCKPDIFAATYEAA